MILKSRYLRCVLRETSALPPLRHLIRERYRAQPKPLAQRAIICTLKVNLVRRVKTYRRFSIESLIGIRNQEIPFRNTRRVETCRRFATNESLIEIRHHGNFYWRVNDTMTDGRQLDKFWKEYCL
ncbi:uncharacterized protein LOC143342822 [Colletes latitarsis]|uniref:uncharacterized protein LOC143342822 n=1 Tax=Colletes latitarsis TaxID=2605962 RepID=UPI004036297B